MGQYDDRWRLWLTVTWMPTRLTVLTLFSSATTISPRVVQAYTANSDWQAKRHTTCVTLIILNNCKAFKERDANSDVSICHNSRQHKPWRYIHHSFIVGMHHQESIVPTRQWARCRSEPWYQVPRTACIWGCAISRHSVQSWDMWYEDVLTVFSNPPDQAKQNLYCHPWLVPRRSSVLETNWYYVIRSSLCRGRWKCASGKCKSGKCGSISQRRKMQEWK